MSAITCCKNCTERHIGCHSKCEKYKANIEEYNKQKKEAEAKKYEIYSSDFTMVNQSMKKKNRKNRRVR